LRNRRFQKESRLTLFQKGKFTTTPGNGFSEAGLPVCSL